MRNEDILLKINDKNNEYIAKHSDEILTNIHLGQRIHKSYEDIFNILGHHLFKNSINDANSKLAIDISREIKNNPKISEAFKKIGSARTNGIILIGIGMSLINLDKFADEVLNDNIDSNNFEEKDLDVLKKLNITNIKKTTLDKINRYLAIGQEEIVNKDTKKKECTCDHCNCNSNKNAEIIKKEIQDFFIDILLSSGAIKKINGLETEEDIVVNLMNSLAKLEKLNNFSKSLNKK